MSLPDAPNATIQQCSTPVIEGENATLQCSATGNPVPSTAWIRKSTGEVVSYNETLIFPNIKRNESSGNYECLAWNGIGNNSTKFCTFDVHCKLAFIFIVAVSCTSITMQLIYLNWAFPKQLVTAAMSFVIVAVPQFWGSLCFWVKTVRNIFVPRTRNNLKHETKYIK